jgi:hypothetical protein
MMFDNIPLSNVTPKPAINQTRQKSHTFFWLRKTLASRFRSRFVCVRIRKRVGFQQLEEHMQAYPSFDGTSACVRIVPFNPFANPAAMMRKKYVIQAQLAQERGKRPPDALLIKAYEIWLRVYQRNISDRAAPTMRSV